MAIEDDEPKKEGWNKAKVEGERTEEVVVRVPRSVVTQPEKFDAARAEPPEADEFGLPTKPPRRRNFSLDELASPEQARPDNDLPLPDPNGSGEEKGAVAEDSKAETKQTPGDNVSSDPVDKEDGEVVQTKTNDSSSASAHIPQKASLGVASEWSHQQLAPRAEVEEVAVEEDEWQDMPALATHRIYDDWGKVLAKEYGEVDDEVMAYGTLGGAGKGYTRVQADEDAQSATSLDENTAYLFKDQVPHNTLVEEDEESRDIVSQMQTTKELLTEGQRIAYVGVVRLSLVKMVADTELLEKTKGSKKAVELATEATRMWAQKMMVRLFSHMEIDEQEQVMVEQLADHGVLPSDLTPALMQNARVKNSKARSTRSSISSSARPSISSPQFPAPNSKNTSSLTLSIPGTPTTEQPPPAYEEQAADDLTVRDPSELAGEKNIDLDLRWTVLCDLFLLLISDSIYDARSRTLLEKVGNALSVEWQELCRFEKRVTDALEMQEQADKENWNEDDHMKAREKAARNRRLMVMGLCTVGGGLVIGLSAGALAPVIGAGLAAGFTGIGVAGTGTFLGGTGAAALIGTTGTLIGGGIGMKTSERRTGAVKTFEYRPLFNNKRVNLIVTVSGWMTGKVDDVRLPFSTVDPIMGDIYSVNWEPEMLQSTGQTIQILGTEALTQTIQQILGATFLATLMAGLSLPIVLTKLSYLIDNPWTVSLARADSTGLILADSLIDRNLGVRPITLAGFSLGSRVIFSCLRELAKRGALGLIQNVYIFGSPVVVKKDEWTRARTVVSGRFVNGYATNDWILAYLFRATSGGIMRVAGLNTVNIPGIENINVTDTVPGHMAYRGMMPTLLHEVGWVVESLEFSEIEDPDPDNHEKRQRELLNEIEEARRDLEEKPEKKGFKAFFSRKKAVQKKSWETYDERSSRVLDGSDMAESERIAAEGANVLFDVDAIRREALQLALEGADVEEIKGHMQIREIQSTMPALKVDMSNLMVAGTNETPSESGAESQRPRTHDGVSRTATEAGESRNAPHEVNGHLTPTTLDATEHGSATENVTMSFEAPDRSSYLSPTSLSPHTSPTIGAPSFRPSPTNTHTPDLPAPASAKRVIDIPGRRSGVFERPPLPRNPATSPSPSTLTAPNASRQSRPPGKNPWDDEEEPGGEKEVSMSFE